MKRIMLVAAALVAAAAPAQAQRPSVTAGVAQLGYRFRDSTGTGEQSGTVFRVGAALDISRLRIAASGLFGEVKDQEGDFSPRSLRQTAISFGAMATDWLELGLEAQARYEERTEGSTLQRLGGPYVRLLVDFGGTGLEGVAETALYPFSSSSNTPSLKTALRALIGARYTSRGPFMVQLSYRFTRLDYQAEAPDLAALTQDEVIALEIGIRKL